MVKRVLNINGLPRTLIVNEEDSLAKVLREQMLLTGCKVGCGQGQCGTCTVILNGKAVRSCIVKMKKVEGNAEITTIEGLGTPDNLHPLQVAWMRTMWLLFSWLYSFRQGSSGRKSFSYQRGGTSLVPGTPECMSLYRL